MTVRRIEIGGEEEPLWNPNKLCFSCFVNLKKVSCFSLGVLLAKGTKRRDLCELCGRTVRSSTLCYQIRL